MNSLSFARRVLVWLNKFSRLFFIRLAIAGLFVLSSLWLFFGGFTGKSFSSPPHFILGGDVSSANPLKLQSIPLTHKNIVVASGFGPHFDVYMAVAWTLKRIMLKDQGNIQVYRTKPFKYKFQEIVDHYGLYKGEYKDYKDLIGDIKSGGDDGGIDLVIFGTCEHEYVFRLLILRKSSH